VVRSVKRVFRVEPANLRVRLLLLVLLAIVPALLVTVYSDVQVRERRAADAGEQALRLARLAAADQEALVGAAADLLRTLAELPEVRSGNAATCGPELVRLLGHYPRYSNLGLIALDGTLTCSALSGNGVYLGDRLYFREAVRSRDFAVGEPQSGRITQRATINFGYPVFGVSDDVQGVVFAALDLDWLKTYANIAQLPPGAALDVFDWNGTVLMSNAETLQWADQPARDVPLVREVLARNRPGTVETAGPDGVSRIYGFDRLARPPSGANVYVAVGFPTELVYADADRALVRNLVVLGVVAILALLATTLAADLLVLRPVQALVAAVARLETGDLRARTGLAPGPDELGQLAQAFDRMAESLERADRERQQQEVLRRENFELEQRNGAVEEANRLKTEFVSMVTHELRTPLTSVLGYANLLLDGEAGELGPEQHEYLTIVKNNAGRLLALINDLLDIARIEAGGFELQRTAVDVSHLVHQVAATLAPMLDAKGQGLSLQIAQPLPPVWADPDRLMQIVVNLVSNAHKYTPPGGNISVVAEQAEGFGRVQVRDTGVGLSADELAQLFTRFFRARNPATRDVTGSGLGLALTRSLVELHGGALSVLSAPGQGSTFSFTMPLADLPGAAQPVGPDVAAGLAPRGRRILIIEDEPHIARLMRRYFERDGHAVRVAKDGYEGLQLARAERPDLITLDILLPDVGGLTVLEQLQADPATATIPVVVVSILPDDGLGKRLGASGYLTKPIREQTLRSMIQRILGQQLPPPFALSTALESRPKT
jgi:signal transduction histidine kinase/ActR/RegA family two-component response regulator